MKKNYYFSLSMMILSFVFVSPAMAQGLEKVNTFLENIHNMLTGVSIVAVTIAIMWAGYKFCFQSGGAKECGMILAGGLLVGGASQFASWLLS